MSENIVNTKDGCFIFIKMAEAMPPIFKEVPNKKWILNGEKDNYPDYLVANFNKSAKHASIIKSKVHYIMGNGWTAGENKKSKFIDQVNDDGEDLMCVSSKCAMDLEIHGGFYLEVIWRKNGTCEIRHADYLKYRSSKDNKTFYYREDGNWQDRKKEPVAIAAFDPNSKKGKQIFYYKDYRPGIDTYTLPGYIAANNYIEADVEISKHTLSNAKTGFMPSKMITLVNGEPTEEEKRLIERKFTDKFSGSDGKKFILSFVNGIEKKNIIDDLGTSDLTKEDFTAVDNLIQQNIFVAHQITSPILFGIRVPGQLGGRDEMREAFEIFQKTYVNSRQQTLEDVFEVFAELNGEKSDLELVPTEPVSFEFGEQIMAQNMLQDEIRDVLGMKPFDKKLDEPTQVLLERLNLMAPKVAETFMGSLTKDEVRSLGGLKPTTDKTVGETNVPANPNTQQNPQNPQNPPDKNNQDPNNQTPQQMSDVLELINEFGKSRGEYCIVKSKEVKFSSHKECLEDELEFFQGESIQLFNPTEQKILDMIRKDPLVPVDGIARALKIRPEEAQTIVNSLTTRGYVEETVNSGSTYRTVSKIVPEAPTKKEIGIKYSYEVRPGFGPAIKSTTRPFCRKMIELDRLYSRKDIETISERLGYNVWEHKGGWYHNPFTGENEDQCRHRWMSHIVVRKIQ